MLKSANFIFLSDSKTVFKSIRNENSRFQTYVMHHMNKIRFSSDIPDWHFVPGKLNISDNCTSTTRLDNITKDNQYLNVPPFLYKSLESVLQWDDVKEEEKYQVENNKMNTDIPTNVISLFL